MKKQNKILIGLVVVAVAVIVGLYFLLRKRDGFCMNNSQNQNTFSSNSQSYANVTFLDKNTFAILSNIGGIELPLSFQWNGTAATFNSGEPITSPDFGYGSLTLTGNGANGSATLESSNGKKVVFDNFLYADFARGWVANQTTGNAIVIVVP